PFGMEFQQGAPQDLDNTIVLSYPATVGLRDSAIEALERQQQSRNNSFEQMDNQPIISYPLYRKQIVLKQAVSMPDGTERTIEFPVRVVAIEKRNEGMSEGNLRYGQKNAYISHGLAMQIKEAALQIR